MPAADFLDVQVPDNTGALLVELGDDLNSNQYQAVCLAARFEEEGDWHRHGISSAARAIAQLLDIHHGTAREWIRIGHALRYLPLIDRAFRTNELTYAKVKVLTRSADEDNEEQLLELAERYSASRLGVMVANAIASEEDDDERDQRQHDARAMTVFTDPDGMVIIRMALAPQLAKPVVAAVDELVRKIAATPYEHASPNADQPLIVTDPDLTATSSDRPASEDATPTDTGTGREADADASSEQTGDAGRFPLADTLRELRQRWQPGYDDDWNLPDLAQQRADAFCVLVMGLKNIKLNTEIVIHVRGDINTFNDGTPITNHAVGNLLPDNMLRLLIHDIEGKPIDATNTRRYPTKRQQRLIRERDHHQCVDCQLDIFLQDHHTPEYQHSGHTITTETVTLCKFCHEARHRKQHPNQQ